MLPTLAKGKWGGQEAPNTPVFSWLPGSGGHSCQETDVYNGEQTPPGCASQACCVRCLYHGGSRDVDSHGL